MSNHVFLFLDDEEKANETKINIGTRTIKLIKVKSGRVVKKGDNVNIIANRNSAVALIAYTGSSCPFKHWNQFYMCFYCRERYTEFPNLYQHVNAVHNTINEMIIRNAFARTEKDQNIKINFMDLVCKICDATFDNFKNLKIHLTMDHQKPVDVDNDGVLPYKILDNIFECLLCGVAYQNYTALNKHINSHFPYFVCKDCGVGCATSQRFRQHMANHGERLHACETCPKTFPTLSRLKEHITRVHLKAKQNKCLFCPASFTKYYEKVKHLKNVHGNTSAGTIPIRPVDNAKQNENLNIVRRSENTKASRESAVAIILNTHVCPFKFNGYFMCMYCQNQFVTMPNLQEHTNVDHHNITEVDIKKAVSRLAKLIPIKVNITDFSCKLCNQELTDFNDLKHHLIGKHKQEIDIKNDGLIAYSMTGDEYACIRCSFKSDNYKSLNKHINDIHFNTFICEQCGLGFATKTGLQCHSISHTSGSYPCEICGKVYRTKWSRRHHVKISHLNVKLNKCTHCPETFKGYYEKVKHIATVHGVRRYNYKCRFCHKSFLSNSNLRNHERVVHAQGHKYVCDNCNYHTYDKHLLKMHMICHSDEKNYKCQVCEKSYARKKTLTEHMKIHNNVRRFVCQHCDRAFVQNCSLKGHMKTHHKDIQNDEGKKNELKISLGISTIKTMTTEVVKTAEIIANRNSAVALIVNTSASCPFRYVNQFYVCVYCQERYEEFSSLYQHVIAVHHSVSETIVREALTTVEKEQKIKVNFMNFTCKICNASFNDFKELKLHLKTDHKEPVDVDNDGVLPYKILDNIYECLLCGINFQNYTNLNKHIKTHSPYFTCNHCGKRYTTLRALKVHTAKHKHLRSREKSHKTCPIVKVKDQNSDRLENKKNNCPICQETFEHSHEIVEHFKNVHGNTSVNTISIPGDGVARQSQNSFQKSVKKRNHKDNAVAIILNTNACPFRYKGNFMCMYCQNKFDVIDDLIQHTTNDHQNVTEADIRKAITKPPTKLNIMDFVCKLCNKELTDFEDLKHHLIGKHKKEIDLENDDLMAYSIKGDDYVCVRCGYKCENYNELSKHINDHFNTFICDQCGRGFGSKTSLHSHTLSHIRGSDPCQICGKKYGNYASKLKHIKIAHHNIHIHRCPYCSETFKDYYPKLKHIAAVHGVKKYYNCRFCPKSFLTNSHFRNHERVAHAQGEKYVCDICDFSTYVKYSLKMHMVCHSDEKNFKCHLCNKSYSRKKCLVQHMKTHYNDRRFVCQHCGKAFVQNCRLTSHMKTVHTDIVKATK